MLRHCTIAELLEVRDGEGTAAARGHVEVCAPCRAEFERLYQRAAALRALPTFSAPRDRWPVVRAALLVSRRRVRIERARWGALAVAAGLVLVVGLRGVSERRSEALVVNEVAALVEESQELEQALEQFQQEGRVVNGVAAVAIVGLEDRIAAIDEGIEQARTAAVSHDEMADLWRERVALMGRLVQTHVQQVAYVGY